MKERSTENQSDNKIHLLKNWRFIIGIILTFAGLDLIFMLSKLPRYTGLAFLIVGLLLLYYTLKKEGIFKVIEERKERHPPFLWKNTFNGKMIKFFPLFGVFLILFDTSYNVFYSSLPSIGSFDLVVLFIAVVLIVYHFIPSKFSKERDFALIFVIFIFLISIVPLILVNGYYSGLEYSRSPIVFYLLALPMTKLLNLVGIDAYAKGITVTYELNLEDLIW